MVKVGCCKEEFLTILLDLVNTVWEEQGVPRDWSDAVLNPIPKKGDLSSCDNWRGISLLEAVGKVMAKILQGRLQQLAETELPESQCGFRTGRGCSDMTFTLRQLVEKSIEHRSKQFITFVALQRPMTLYLAKHCGMHWRSWVCPIVLSTWTSPFTME